MTTLSAFFEVTPALPPGESYVTLPSKRIKLAGIQSIVIYPWNDVTGPYDATTAENLYGLQGLDITMNSTDAQFFGGESVYEEYVVEVKRELEIKFEAIDFTLRAFSVLMGGNLTVDPFDGAANTNSGSGDEFQYLAGGAQDSTGFFRLIATATKGTGIATYTFPKLRASGGQQYSLKMDSVHIPSFSARALLDSAYVRQDGQVGAAYEFSFGNNGQLAQHS